MTALLGTSVSKLKLEVPPEWIAIALAGLILLFLFLWVLQITSLYMMALTSNASIGFFELIRLRLRRHDVRTLVVSRIRLVKAGIDVPTNRLIDHAEKHGNLPNVVGALIAARAIRMDLNWDAAAAMDLRGIDVLAEVKKTAAQRPQ